MDEYFPLANADYLSLEQVRTLLAAIDRDATIIGKRDYALVLTVLRSGRSARQIRTLRWGEAADFLGQAYTPDVAAPIEVYLRAAGRWEGLQAGEYIFAPEADPLHTLPTGRAEEWDASRPVGETQMNFHLKRYACWAGLDPGRVTWHSLKRTALLLRLEMGDELKDIAAFLGRKSTENIEHYFQAVAKVAPLEPAAPAPAARSVTARKNVVKWRIRYLHQRRQKPGLKQGNVYKLKHGLYSKKKPEEILAALIAEQKVIGGEVIGLKAEVLGLRILLGQLFGQALEQVTTTEELLKVLDHFGKNSVRLAALLKAEKELDGGQSELEKTLSQALAEVAAELKRGGAGPVEQGSGEEFGSNFDLSS